MKQTHHTNWTSLENCRALMFFTQLMEELLFDYTHSTYKPSIMNTPGLCNEALSAIRDIEKGSINPAHINHIVEELTHSLRDDDVAQSLLTSPLGSILSELNQQSLNLRDLEVTLELLKIQLNTRLYEQALFKGLKEAITAGYDTKSIRKLTRLTVTHLISRGISQDFIRDQIKQNFRSKSKNVTSNEDINNFLGSIPQESTEYDVYFIVDNSLKHALQYFERFDIEILDSAPANLADEKFFKTNNQRFILVARKVKAFDPYAARKIAEGGLKFSSTLMSLYHHKQEATWSSENIVTSETKIYNIRANINPMHRCKDLVPEAANKRIEEFMSNFNMKKDSFSKFIRSAQLHSMALRTKDVENQILNLWIALESLVPDDSKDEKTNTIQHIVDSMIPFLNHGYIDGLINNLIKDLLRWNYQSTTSLLKLTGSDSYTKSLCLIFFSEEHQAALIDFRQKLNSFPLLIDRFDHIQELTSSPANIIKALDNHAKRIEWQIKRIYRTRNIIVHTGNTPPRTGILVEHTHDYLDTVFNLLIKLASNPIQILSVPQGFKYIQMEYKMRGKKLSKNNLNFDSNNILSLIFSN
ncbi:hypothetical protein ABEG91_05365 [Pantoea agglomerans]|uniref:hypothetical protein n=1 Tax=Enterobacter agglomerans TaxID=549 RepID=UPI003209579A